MTDGPSFTRHARDRTTARSIPPGVVDIILTYGESQTARDGARKHGLSGASMRNIQRNFGREVAKAFAAFRSAYVVETDGRVITVAFSSHPIFY